MERHREVRLSTPELSCVQLHLLKINVSGLFLSVLACECYLYFLQTGPVASNMHSTGAPGAMIHVQASLPQGILGLNSISTHGANVRASLHGLLLHHFLGKNIGNFKTDTSVVFISADEPVCCRWAAISWFTNTATALSSSSFTAGVHASTEHTTGTAICSWSVS